MGVIWFNGASSQALSILVEHPPDYEYPKKDLEIVHVPGRNGDVVLDKGSWQNVDRAYKIAAVGPEGGFAAIAVKVSKWLHGAPGYARLEDSYEPDFFRMAFYQEDNTITNLLSTAGRATVKFNCKPQRFLKSGETAVPFEAAGILSNPTAFAALPVVTVSGEGDGAVQIGDRAVQIAGMTDSLVLDSVLQDAYRDTENLNPLISLPDGFPRLLPGDNDISFTGGITGLSVVPNWWTL